MSPQILVILATDGRRPPHSDRAALALGVSALEGTVTACTRADDVEASRYAAASGVEQFLEPLGLEDFEFDIALFGRGDCGDAGDLLPALLAERRGAALAYEVVDVRQEKDRLAVTRALGHGARDILSVRGPAVLVIADSARRPSYVSRRRVLAASVPPVRASAPSSEPSSQTTWERIVPRVRLGDHAAKVEGSATTRMRGLLGIAGARGKVSDDSHVVTGSPETCAQHLLRYLVHHGFIAKDIEDATEPEAESRAGAGPGPRGGVLSTSRRSVRGERGPRRATDREPRIARRPLPHESVSTRIESRAPRPVKGRRIARRGPYRMPDVQGREP